jgi:hypothetical protein
VLDTHGHIFVLTSHGLYFWPQLGERFLRGGQIDGKTRLFFIPFDAMDCSLAYGEYLFLLVSGGVSVLQVSKLIEDIDAGPAWDPGRIADASFVEAFEMTPDVKESPLEASPRYSLALEPVALT